MIFLHIRNKQKQESDFLILKNRGPWLLLEAKRSDSPIDRHHFEMIRAVGDAPFVQVFLAYRNSLHAEKEYLPNFSEQAVRVIPFYQQ